MEQKEEVPEWALERVDELRRAEPGDSLVGTTVDAFARYIAAHEEPPKDPLKRVVREMFGSVGWSVSNDEIAKATEALREHMPALIAAKGDA